MIRHSIGDYYLPDEQIQFGTIKINNPGFFWINRKEFLWHNLESRLRVGELDNNYEDMEVMLTGVARDPRFDHVVEIDVTDKRVLLHKLLEARFDSTNYPNVETAWANKAIPILLATKTNITPPSSNTTTFEYKVSQTVFNGITYPLAAISAVYKDGAALATPGDYSVNLNTGIIDLVADPAGGIITCDADGLVLSNPTGDADFDFTPAGFIWFLYVLANAVSKYDMNLGSLVDLFDIRTIAMGDWIDEETDSLDYLITLKKSAVFHTFVNRVGLHSFWGYSENVPDDTLRFYNNDYKVFPKLGELTEQTFKEIVIKFNQDPTTDVWKESEDSDNSVEWKYDIKERLPIETLGIATVQAGSLATNYLEMQKNPPETLSTVLPHRALALNPGDKSIFSYSVKDNNGVEITILDEVTYRILSLEKNINTGEVGIFAILDADVYFFLM